MNKQNKKAALYNYKEIKSNLYSKVVMPYVMQRMQYSQQQQQNSKGVGATTAATIERVKNLQLLFLLNNPDYIYGQSYYR